MFCTQDPVNPDYPFQFTPNEIQQLMSLFQSPIPSPNSGSEVSNQAVHSLDDRKRRRMISNRESARRSRWRKKKHLENLTEQANRLKTENKVLKNRLGSVINKCNVAWKENQNLRTESVVLLTRLQDLCHVLVSMQQQQQQQVINSHTNYNHQHPYN